MLEGWPWQPRRYSEWCCGATRLSTMEAAAVRTCGSRTRCAARGRDAMVEDEDDDFSSSEESEED